MLQEAAMTYAKFAVIAVLYFLLVPRRNTRAPQDRIAMVPTALS